MFVNGVISLAKITTNLKTNAIVEETRYDHIRHTTHYHISLYATVIFSI